MPNIKAVLKAADVFSALSFINIQELLPHMSKLEDALCILQEKVEATRAIQTSIQLSSSNSSNLASSNLENDTQPENSEHNSTQPENSEHQVNHMIQKVLSALSHEKSNDILDFLSFPIRDFLENDNSDWYGEDPRVVDLRLSCHSKSTLDIRFRAKLRRGLSQRSLAVEYDKWEKKTFSTSRITELSEDPASSNDHQGYIKKFIEAHAPLFKDKNTTLHGIKQGIRLLVFEKMYGAAGSSSIFIFTYGPFRSVKYKLYPNLKGLFERTSWNKVARERTNWLIQYQALYDGN
ncbi:hypothetical protein N7495_001983 [Penicillium taxi]|uniref:uncharacterized protein n=1 Tax=Penicillium taxi TaxID=168475 RepID=UPI00254571A1|nr:uncharacterized protein N7495_001983 [Penicillium taxi]KAJ5901455.1 hypothetical protein N7495_001983 [Penicillium taxi]